MERRLLRIRAALFALCLFIAGSSESRAQFAAQQTWCSGSCVGGTANAIALAIPNITNLSDILGVPLRFVVSAPNTGSVTIAAGSAAAASVKKISIAGPVALTGSEFIAGNLVIVVYDGTQYTITANGAPQFQGITGSATFSTPGSPTWTVPAGITTVKRVRIWGAGGGGGFGGDNGGGSAGCGGGYAEKNNISVIPGAVLTVTVGAGGTPGTSGNAGDGGTSSFQGVSCTGGAGGVSANGNYAGQPTGIGTCTGADFTVHGGAGSGGQTPSTSTGGAAFGTSASQVVIGVNSFPAPGGNFPGGGASGGTNTSGSGQENGGTGGGGLVVIDY